MALDTPAKRLKWARERDGRYKTATEAARAFGWTISTYLGHENEDRSPSRAMARKYAKSYKVRWEWLLEGEGQPTAKTGKIEIAGYVGAGAEFIPFGEDSPALGEAPATVEANTSVVIVRGDSMYPRYFDGELLYFIKEERPASEFIGRECVLKLKDGRMFVKIVRKGSTRHHFHLESWNGPTIEDQVIEWAAPVTWRKG